MTRRLPARLVVLLALCLAIPGVAHALNKAEVFARAAPATVLIVVPLDKGMELGSGVIVDPKGRVVTNWHVVKALSQGSEAFVFLYDPKERALDENVADYLRAHKDKALKPRLLRYDVQNDLALLELPGRAQPYPTVQLGDSDAVQVGLDVVAIGSPQGLTWTLTTGTVSAIRKNALQTETAINPGNSGGPLLDMEARVVGINTYIVKGAQSLGFARPANVVKAFLAGRSGLGATVATSQTHKGGKGPLLGPGDVVGKVMKSVSAVLAKRVGPAEALRLSCELLAASTFSGRAAVSGAGKGDVLNEALIVAFKEAGAARQAAEKLVSDHFPLVAVGSDGQMWLRRGARYVSVGPVVAWDVDDMRGTIYATNRERSVYVYDEAKSTWIDTGVRNAYDIEATNGTLYAVLTDGTLLAVTPEGTRRLSNRSIQGTLLGSLGMLYVTEKTGALYRFRDGAWDLDGKPVAQGVRALAANGLHWFGLDGKGHIFSGAEGRYIDSEGDAAGIWVVGRDLLALSAEGKLFYYESASRHWHPIGD